MPAIQTTFSNLPESWRPGMIHGDYSYDIVDCISIPKGTLISYGKIIYYNGNSNDGTRQFFQGTDKYEKCLGPTIPPFVGISILKQDTLDKGYINKESMNCLRRGVIAVSTPDNIVANDVGKSVYYDMVNRVFKRQINPTSNIFRVPNARFLHTGTGTIMIELIKPIGGFRNA